ncbi:MAG: hypothetical protein M2R45_02201 [Verrucomicrobia subdivision 3 bacterium]|nr:hypothetical protein [Limisphaerales bacterium]MCS1413777.1 hypothetical protein [Limisphaerales bacterium]
MVNYLKRLMRYQRGIFKSINFLVAVVFAIQISADPVTLYDGNLRSLPGDQGWIYLLNPLVRNQARQVVVDRAVNLTTLRNFDDHAGYFARSPLFDPHPQLPDEFNRERGYQIGFTIQLPTETHVRPDRAGFSLITLSRDLLGIEIEFWTDEIFAQSVEFIHSEGAQNLPFQLSSQYVDFVLEIKGDEYTLSGNGQEILTGPLRDYSGSGIPYTISDFLFFGDNTTSASASVNIRSIWIDTELPGATPPPVDPGSGEPSVKPEPPAAVSDKAIFSVIAEKSTITLSGIARGNAIKTQGDGSLSTTYTGEIHTILSDSNIIFQPTSQINANPSGDWMPLAGGGSGAAPADYGAVANVIITTANAAARNVEFSLASDPIDLNPDGSDFPVNGLSFAIPEGSSSTLDVSSDGLFPLMTSQSIAGLGSVNDSDDPATIAIHNNIQTLTIPIQANISLRLITPNDVTLTFSGQIVASRELPADPQPPAVKPPLPQGPVVPDTPPTLAIQRLSASELQLSWDAVPDRTYTIEQSANLTDWQTTGKPTVADAETASWTGLTAEAHRYYRAILQPAGD